MRVEKNLIRLVMSVTAIFAASLIISNIALIFSLFTPIHYWDQWEMAKYVSEGKSLSLAYLLTPHNEHIIFTSKILYYMDLWLFDYTNRSLVAEIVVLHLSIALALSLILTKACSPIEKLLWFCVFGALMLSLAQWENLTIGFQTQFGLTGLFAILACHFATRFADQSKTISVSFAGVAVCTPLTVFSMGNGIALVCSFLVIAVLARMRPSRAIVLLVIYTACLVLFIVQRNGSSATIISHNETISLGHLLLFFMAVLGGTFTGNFTQAVAVGAGIVATFTVVFVFSALIPWSRRKKIDNAVITLFAISIFALASAAAVAIGRVPLGPGAALTSRYATPNLLLYCSLIAAYCRWLAVEWQAERRRILMSCLFALIGLGLALGLATRTSNLKQLTNRSETLTSASYFVLSGVMSDNVLAELYPVPDAIRAPMEYMRANKLNIFSPRFGLTTLSQTTIDSARSLATCSGYALERASRIEESSWQVSGSIRANQTGHGPAWMIAINSEGNVLGYAPPVRNLSAGIVQFVVPIHDEASTFDKRIYLIAKWNDKEMCRFEQPIQLPERYFVRHRPEITVGADYQMSTSIAASTSKVPALAEQNGVAFPVVRSTWQGDDAATGSIAYTLGKMAGKCAQTFVGVMRGPTAEGLALQIREGNDLVETLTLDGISQHQWWWLEITGANGCSEEGNTVTLVDNGRAWGAWAAITAPISVPSHRD